MEDRAETIRRQIASYRQELADGLNGERAVFYLREIKRLQSELDNIEGDSDKRE